VTYDALVVPGASNLSAFKSIRLLRLFKLLRLARINRLLQQYQDVFDITAYLGLIMTMFGIFFAMHMMSCFWYLVGTAGGERKLLGADGAITIQEYSGWVEVDPTWCGKDGDGYCVLEEIATNVPLGTRYVRSLYTTFQKDFAYTVMENVFGIFGELVVGFIYGGLAGVISSIMMTQGAGERESMAKMLSIKAWMKARGINKRDKAKIMAHVNSQSAVGANFNERDILDELPPALAGEISYHLYHSYVERLPMFRSLGKEVVTHLCRVVRPVTILKDHIVYEERTVGSEMYVVLDGEVEVTKGGERLGFLGKSAFFGENPIIDLVTGLGGDGCEVRLRTCRASVDTELGVIHKDDIEELIQGFPELEIRLRNFNRIGKRLSVKGATKQKMEALRVEAVQSAGANPSGAASADSATGQESSVKSGPDAAK
jgi:CRP-like cAMP-binding protein